MASEEALTTVSELSDGDDFQSMIESIPEGELRVIKFWAPWCRACKGLDPKFKRIAQLYPTFNFYGLNWEENKVFCKTIGVNALPLVKMFTCDGEVESFPCGPKKVEILRGKLDELAGKLGTANLEAEGAGTAHVNEAEATVVKTADMRRVTGKFLQESAPDLFGNLSLEKCDELLKSSVVTSFEDGDLICEQGVDGTRLYFLLSGACDVHQKSKAQIEEELASGAVDAESGTEWGTFLNKLVPEAYFGERSILSQQPRSFTVIANGKVRCLTIDKPALVKADPEKWGEGTRFLPATWGAERRLVAEGKQPIVAPVTDQAAEDSDSSSSSSSGGLTDQVPTIVRFKLLRSAVRAFEHTNRRLTPKWGDAEEQGFRTSLVQQLSPSQLAEYKLAFQLLDHDDNGSVESWELAKALGIFRGREKGAMSEEELSTMINKADPSVDGNTALYEKDFIAIMAEAEYSAFFLEAFSLLDERGNGFVEAGELLEVLNNLKVMTPVQLQKLMKDLGVDSDGHVEYEAFVNLMMSTSSTAGAQAETAQPGQGAGGEGSSSGGAASGTAAGTRQKVSSGFGFSMSNSFGFVVPPQAAEQAAAGAAAASESN